MTCRRRFAVSLLVAIVAGIPGTPSLAAAREDRALALDLFEQGRTLFKSGNYAAALRQFEAAAKVMRSFGILLNIAECHEKLGRTASAWATWREARAVALVAQKADDEAMAAERQQALEPALSRLTIVVPPGTDLPDLEVLRDGVIVPREAWGRPIAVDPGSHLIEARAPGRKARSVDVSVQGNADKRSVTLSPLVADGPSAAPMAAPPSVPARTTSELPVSPPPPAVEASHGGGSGQRLAGWVVAGLGVAGAGAGIAVALVGQGQHNDAVATDLAGNLTQAQGMEADANATKTAGYVTIGVGGAFLVSGLVMVLTAPSSGGDASGRVWASPWVSLLGGGAGATVSSTW